MVTGLSSEGCLIVSSLQLMKQLHKLTIFMDSKILTQLLPYYFCYLPQNFREKIAIINEDIFYISII